MKKVFFICFMAVFLTSCEKTTIIDNGLLWRIVELRVPASDWRVGDGFYFVNFTLPELSRDIYQNGLVQCYIDYGNAQAILPLVRHHGDGEFLWTQTIDYEYSINRITIFVTNSDFFLDPPGRMDFVLHLIR